MNTKINNKINQTKIYQKIKIKKNNIHKLNKN